MKRFAAILSFVCIAGSASVAEAQVFLGFDDWGDTLCVSLGGLCQAQLVRHRNANFAFGPSYDGRSLEISYVNSAATPKLLFADGLLPPDSAEAYFEAQVRMMPVMPLGRDDRVGIVSFTNREAGYVVEVGLAHDPALDDALMVETRRGPGEVLVDSTFVPLDPEAEWQRVAVHVRAAFGARVDVAVWLGDAPEAVFRSNIAGGPTSIVSAGSFNQIAGLTRSRYGPDLTLWLDDVCVGATAEVRYMFCDIMRMDRPPPPMDAGADGATDASTDSATNADGAFPDAEFGADEGRAPEASFRGSGGCACGAAGSEAPMVPALFGALWLALLGRRRAG